MFIRQATEADIYALTRLLGLLFAIEADFSADAGKQRQGLRLLLSDTDRSLVLVAEVDEQVVGMCTAQVVVSTAEGGPAAWVEDMVVAPEYRGRGIGRRLLQQVEVWAGERGISRLQLVADQDTTPALEFYAREGWSRTRLICLRSGVRLSGTEGGQDEHGTVG